MRTLLQKLATWVTEITVTGAEERVERKERYERIVGYDALRVRLKAY